MPHPLNKRYQTGTQHQVQGFAHNFKLLNDKLEFLEAARVHLYRKYGRLATNESKELKLLQALIESTNKQKAVLLDNFESELLSKGN